MLEVLKRDGRGRTALWQPGAPSKPAKPGTDSAPMGPQAATPGLLWPDTSFGSLPSWAAGVITKRPGSHPDRIELASGGTWFHPVEYRNAPLVVPAIKPAPTTVVQVIPVGSELAVFHDAAGWSKDPKNLVPALITARREAGAGRLFWAPGVGTPADYPLWVYAGVDLFDASPLLRAAIRGQILTAEGPLSVEEARAILGRPLPDEASWIATNLDLAHMALERTRIAIEAGKLRELVERRCYATAWGVEFLRRLDREHIFLEAAAPRHRSGDLKCITPEALTMPEVESFRRRLREGYEPPAADVLVLFPCSARKPYKTSRTHRLYSRVLDDSGIRGRLHEVMVTSPLGLVPREIEEVYPAASYDIPVTGHWTQDEKLIVRNQLKAILAKASYRAVVVHTSAGTFEGIRDLLPADAVHTVQTHPTDRADLARLGEALAKLKTQLGSQDARRAGPTRKLEDLRALASMQFGAGVARDLVANANAHGHLPYVKLEGPEGQRGSTTPGRGVLSLTLEGAAIVARHGQNRVFIGDFKPKGTSSLFGVGVESGDANIRPGDEVAVVRRHADGTIEVRGCGVANMPAEEMGVAKRGVAVTLRHTGTPRAAPTVGDTTPAGPSSPALREVTA